MTDEIRYAVVSHIGKKRINNEDNFWCCGNYLPMENNGTEGVLTGTVPLSSCPAFAVMDGMGGESCGEQAAFLAACEFGDFYEQNRLLLPEDKEALFQGLCVSMNQKVVRYAVDNHVRVMGSTIVFLAFGKRRCYAGNLGDSRLYLVRGRGITRVSTDHVYSRDGNGKGPLVQYLGIMEPDVELDPSPVILSHRNRDMFLLCSDGVTDMLPEEQLWETLNSMPDPEAAAGKILEDALEAGGRDNITAIVLKLEKQGWFSFLKP